MTNDDRKGLCTKADLSSCPCIHKAGHKGDCHCRHGMTLFWVDYEWTAELEKTLGRKNGIPPRRKG